MTVCINLAPTGEECTTELPHFPRIQRKKAEWTGKASGRRGPERWVLELGGGGEGFTGRMGHPVLEGILA